MVHLISSLLLDSGGHRLPDSLDADELPNPLDPASPLAS